IYDLLASAPLPPISEELLRRLGWAEVGSAASVLAAVEAVTRKADDVRHQQLGYVGRLTCHAKYRAELGELRRQWAALPVTPPWPLSASTADQLPVAVGAGTADPAPRLPEVTVAFLEATTKFLRRWYLALLTTWDLPVPQGPLEH